MNRLRLNKEIYSDVDIKIANNDFNKIAKISYKEDISHYVIFFYDCLYDVTLTMKEYENYIIDLMASNNGK